MSEDGPPAGAGGGPPAAPDVPAWRAWRVGERVVVRYRLPPGTPGPRHSDALGDVVAVGPEGVTVRTRSGDVAVPASEIALGKRVPPPPPSRARRAAGGRRGPDG
jgi:hypothetical protein